MSNARKVIDELIELLKECCLHYLQLIHEWKKIYKLESQEQSVKQGSPIYAKALAAYNKKHKIESQEQKLESQRLNPELFICRADGKFQSKFQALKKDQAIAYYEAQHLKQMSVIDKVQENFSKAIDKAKIATRQPDLEHALGSIVPTPTMWLTDLFKRLKSMHLTSKYLYMPVDDSASPTDFISPDGRTADLTVVRLKLDHLQAHQERTRHPTLELSSATEDTPTGETDNGELPDEPSKTDDKEIVFPIANHELAKRAGLAPATTAAQLHKALRAKDKADGKATKKGKSGKALKWSKRNLRMRDREFPMVSY